MKIRHPLRLLTLIAVSSLPQLATGQIYITSWSLSATEATFTVSGSTTVDFDPLLAGGIYIGVSGDTDWILSDTSNSSGSISGTIDGYSTSTTAWGSYSTTEGDFLFFTNSADGEYNFMDGGSIELVATVGGNYAPTALNEQDLIITWGRFANATMPDAATQIGSFSAVPEPSTYAALFGVVALGGAIRWRRRDAA